MARWESAANIINDAAVECGLSVVADPFGSIDPAFVQLCRMLTGCGRELIGVKQWQKFVSRHSFNTNDEASGVYSLPEDYLYMIDQTGWTPTNRLPMGGPLSEQDWSFIVGSGWNQYTIYVSFKEADGELWITPNDPVPTDIEVTFEYISNAWAESASGTPLNRLTASDDTVYFPPVLITKLLKLRFLEAKGFDTTAALGQYNTALATWVPKDKSAPVLSMSNRRLFPYLDWRNIPETNFGPPP
jgi:hypothetical protein